MPGQLRTILSILTAIGFGSVLGSFFTYVFQNKAKAKEKEQEVKLKRYQCIQILMLAKVDPSNIYKVHIIRPDLQNIDDISNEIEVELLNALLFASDNVIKAMINFIKAPNYSSYLRVVTSMRRELWGKHTKINETDLKFFQTHA